MRRGFKRLLVPLLLLSAFAMFLPGTPWSDRVRHTLKKATFNTEMRLAKWRGVEPRLISISGQLDRPGIEVQALDSRSGWAAMSGPDGSFVLPDVMWYPGSSYDLVFCSGAGTCELLGIRAPQAFPDNGIFSIGNPDPERGRRVDIASMLGANAATTEKVDKANLDYYNDLFAKLTAGKESDDEKVGAIHEFVSSKLNYNETQWELGSARRVLEQGSQYCGHLSSAMETLLTVGGYQARAVHMSDGNTPPGTHAVVEVFYGGDWHLYDPTFGVKFVKEGKVASYRDLRLNPSMVSEELLQRFDPKSRRLFAALLTGVYSSGYHHYYYLNK
jgi:hypothetical protein